MSLLLRSLVLCICLFAILAQTGCQTRGARSTTAPTQPVNVINHTVLVGETLSSIAARYDVSIDTLVSANSLRGNSLIPGTVLRVPGGKFPIESPVAGPIIPAAPAIEPNESWYQPRAKWTQQPIILSRTKPMGGTPNVITIHHSGDKDDIHTESAAWLRQVDLNHIKGTNHAEPWACIGYHFIIDVSGKVYEGRPLKYQGAHAGNDQVNKLNIGICLIGDFDQARVPAAQRTALLSTLDRLCLQYGINRASVYGHQHFKSTECPGRFLSQIIASYTQRPVDAAEPTTKQAVVPRTTKSLGTVTPARK
jgi:LysM repeat protein